MLRKIAFKRTSLAVIAALTFGTLSSVAPVQAGGLDDTLTLSASSATVTVNETATVTATVSFTSQLSGAPGRGKDSVVVHVAGSAPGTLITSLPVADTVNTNTALYGKTIVHLPQVPVSANTGAQGVGTGNETRLATTEGAAIGSAGVGFRTDSIVAVADGAFTRASYKISAPSVSTPGTYIWTISVRDLANTVLYKTATFTLTVTSGDNTATSASRLWLHDRLYTNMSINTNVGTPTRDSTLVVNAGLATAAGTNIVGYMVPEFVNAAGETRNATSGVQPNESMTIVVSGPGLLGSHVGRADATADSTPGKSVIVSRGDTVIVYSDGTAGVGTFSATIGTAATPLTQAAKTITFVGRPASFVITSDSAQVVSSAAIAYQSISFVVKDSAGNNITDVQTTYNTGTPSGFFLTVPDTKVVGGTAVVNTASNAWTACAYNSTRLRWFCDVPVTDSGSVTVTIADSRLASNAVVTATATYTVVGAAAIGTMAFDKATYAPGEIAILTLTAKDRNGNNAINGANNPFGTITWNTGPIFTITTGSNAAGGTFGTGAATHTTLESYVSGGTTYVNGVDTAVVYMPTRAGTYTLTTTTNGTVATPVTLTFKVVDAVADAATAATNKSIADAQAAADAATDAALEAIDAANAATDAANLAAEAADAATVAAEEARDAADAATAAVEALATEVASLMAALKAQITTLARTVAKIAKKVNA